MPSRLPGATSAYPGRVAPTVLLGAVLLAAGGGLLTVGMLGWQRRLPRNRVAGVRTPATLRSQEAFTAGNRVAAPPVLAAGAVCVLGGTLAFGARGTALWMLVGGVGVVALVLVAAGGVLGDRAASMVRPAGCGGCACGAGDCGR